MNKKRYILIIWIFIALFFVSQAFSNQVQNWFSGIIQSGNNVGALGFWRPNSNTNNTLDFLIKNNGVEVNGSIKISGNSPSFGKVLTATDNLGNATWSFPNNGINFTEIAGYARTITANQFIDFSPSVKHINYTGFKIDFPDYGTYSLTIQAAYLPNVTIQNASTIEARIPIVQFLPSATNGILWNSANPRFSGSYEVYATSANLNWSDYRFYISQNIIITPQTGKTAYLWLNDARKIGGKFYIGKNGWPGCPQCTGGSYTRIQ